MRCLPRRRRGSLARSTLVALALALGPAPADAADPDKVLRVALPDVSTLDPQQASDLYSVRVAHQIYEALYEFDYLADPARVVPNTAEDLPRIDEDGKRWTIRLKPGIRFTDDPAFRGRPRELVAEDYVYSIKRSIDPTLRSGGDAALSDLIVGARAVVDAARRPGGRFDYDAPIEGLRALDRHTLQFRLVAPDYTLLERLAAWRALAVAREVIEARGADTSVAPVGTGPFRLLQWKRGSQIVLEANPGYRPLAFPVGVAPRHAAIAAEMKGVALPAIGRIEIAIMEEPVPELLEFDRGRLDYALLGGAAARRLLDGGKLRPEVARRGIRHARYIVPALLYTYFNLDDPVVGGYAPERIALRRAIGLGFDVPEAIRVIDGGDGVPASQLLPPGVDGHDPRADTKAMHDPAAARALLDRFGYRDRDGDGFRERPDGSPLTLVTASMPDSLARQNDELWLKSMKAIGLRVTTRSAPFADLLKQAASGQLQMFDLGYRSPSPSGYAILATLWGKSPPDTNHSRFRNPDYDAAYEAFLRTPPGPQRDAIARRMSAIVAAYAPIAYRSYPVGHAFAHPWVKGYHPTTFGNTWKFLDIDLAQQRAARR
ncbi:MAG TPA: ABC transporter substrate-binding protein [Casimicrobiaceae bacterium]|nr:ABC transporter substrate-binding protein [Casimicrobiaceae bacterium]